MKQSQGNSLKRLNMKTKIIYGFGNFGIGLVIVTHMLYLVYFFFPPKSAGLPIVIPQGTLFLGITLLGVITGLGRLVDAITDPLIASWSDNCSHKSGKRLIFLRNSSFFFAASYALVFFVPLPEGICTVNIIWVALFLVLSSVFLTTYIIPYNALIVELAEHPDDKVDMVTIGSIMWFIGFLIVSFSGNVWNLFIKYGGLSVVAAMKYTFVIIWEVSNV